jgi:hypothetical protein
MADGLREEDIPPPLLPKAMEWWNRQMASIAKAHGSEWPKHRDWIVDYLNAELREHLQKRGLWSR